MPTLLVIDDEPNVLFSLEASLRDEYEVVTAATGRQGIDLARKTAPDAVLLDVRLGDMSGLEVFEQIRAIDPLLPVVLMTAYTTTQTAIEATKRGAFEYLLKPVDLHQLQEVVGRALAARRLRAVPAVPDRDDADPGADVIVGRGPAMQEVF